MGTHGYIEVNMYIRVKLSGHTTCNARVHKYTGTRVHKYTGICQYTLVNKYNTRVHKWVFYNKCAGL